ncbi:MAG: YicC/YloC family endoribonuclease [Peptoniphilaceae bacterium]
MTGYGIGKSTSDILNIKVEVKSVNNRYCDINIRLPKNLLFLEDKIRKTIKNSVSRGKIDVFINLEYINSTNTNIDIDSSLAKEYYKALKKLKDELDIKGEINLRDIYSMNGVIINRSKDEDIDFYYILIKEALDEALNNFISMRETEGENIKLVFNESLKVISSILANIKERATISLEKNIEKLKSNIANNIDKDLLDLPRLTTEIAIMCDKLSIDEETTRVGLHLEQFNDIINSQGAIGRKLDFLIQELNREVNTIGSKSTDIEILNSVINLKSEIEKLREQVQNIE